MLRKAARQQSENTDKTLGSAALTVPPVAKASQETTLQLHAANMEARHAKPDPNGPCEFCRVRQTNCLVSLDWEAVYNTREDVVRSAVGLAAILAIGHGRTFEHKAYFTTNHSSCSGCYGRLSTRRLTYLVAEKICLGILVVGMFGAIAAMMFGTTLWSRPTDENRLVFCVSLAVATIGLGLGFSMPKKLRKWRIPKALRSVGTRPFVLDSCRRSSMAGSMSLRHDHA
jgi:hypothetical protein